MKISLGLLAVFVMTASVSFAQSVNPARLYEQSRGTQSPVEGVWHVYDKNGNLVREENYSNYRLDGEMKIYYPSGALKEVLYYSDGYKEGSDKAYYENGGVEHEANYAGNDLEGASVHYYDTGEVKSREQYTKGHLNGRRSVYFKNGILKQSMDYDHGLLEGAVITYAEDGKATLEEHYDNGKLVGHNEYDDKSTYEAKNDKAGGAVAPVASSTPLSPDAPTKL